MIEMQPKYKIKQKDGILVLNLISYLRKIRKVLERSYEFIFDFILSFIKIIYMILAQD